MKRIIILFIISAFCVTTFAQKITQLPVVTSAVGGSLLMVRSGTSGNQLSQITKDNLIPTEEAENIFVKLLPDTVTKAASFTLALTDANKLIHTTKATSILVTIPPNNTVAIPVGTTINFVQSAAGIIVFKEGVGVNLYSKKDSVATGGIWSWAALYKRGTNNWILYGDIID